MARPVWGQGNRYDAPRTRYRAAAHRVPLPLTAQDRMDTNRYAPCMYG